MDISLTQNCFPLQGEVSIKFYKINIKCNKFRCYLERHKILTTLSSMPLLNGK